MPHLNRRGAGLISLMMAGGILLVGLWPLDFRPPNGVRWLKDRAGLSFRPQGIAFDSELMDWPAKGQADQPATFTLELRLEPEQPPATDAFYILSIDDGHFPSGMVLCQWETHLLLRIREPAHDRGFREVGPDDALAGHAPRTITITADPQGTTFYLNGSLAQQFPGFVVPSSYLNGGLVLGNAAAGKHPWTGNLLGLAFFRRALTASEVAQHQALWTSGQADRLAGEPGLAALYLFDEKGGLSAQDLSANRHRLLIPERYQVLQKRVLELPWGPAAVTLSDLDDIAINVLGFVPFGFMVFWYRQLARPDNRIGNAIWAIGVGAVLSLAIELTQVWLPNRTSSALDLVCNTLGTGLGVLIARKILSGKKPHG